VRYWYFKIEPDMIAWSAGHNALPTLRYEYTWDYVTSPTFGAVRILLGGGRM